MGITQTGGRFMHGQNPNKFWRSRTWGCNNYTPAGRAVPTPFPYNLALLGIFLIACRMPRSPYQKLQTWNTVHAV
jgi:hypothetical protein